MRILKIIHGYPPHYNAGSEVYTQSLCNALAVTHEVFVFTREEDPYRPDFVVRQTSEHERLHFFYVNMARGKDGYRHRQLDQVFAELLETIRPDVAHIGHLNHLSTGIVDVLHRLHIPIVFTLHDFWLMCPRGQFLQRGFGTETPAALCSGQENAKCASNCYSAFFASPGEEQDLAYWTGWVSRRMQETRSIAGKVSLFIAPSHALRNRFVNDFGIPENKIRYLDYGFPLHYLQPVKPAPQRHQFTFGYIGTHIPAKGINLLIHAFGKLEGNARLLIWGSKDEQSTAALRKQAAETGKDIIFKGSYINSNLADTVFAEVDCIVVPSVWMENSPLVIHEAQACHIPVITADCGGMAEYVQHEVNGYLFRHRDADDLARRMQQALNDPAKIRALGKRGYLAHPEGKIPGIAAHVKEMETIYTALLQSSPVSLRRITIDTNPEDCNLRCVMCEEHSPFSTYMDELYKTTGKRKRRMPLEWLPVLFEQASALGVQEVIPSTMGEPLIYPGIDKMYALAAAHGVKINLTTNGTFPRRPVNEWAKLLIPHTSDVKISWNGATRETAEAVMSGIDFEKAVAALEEFVVLRDRYFEETGTYCRVTLQLTFMQNNMHELGAIVKLAAAHNVDRVKGHHLWAHFEEIKNLAMNSSEEGIRKWNGYVAEAQQAAEQYRRPNGEKVLLENIIPLETNGHGEVPEHYACPFLGKELWISAAGKISPCCAPDKQRDSLGDFGNIAEQSLPDVLQSKQYRDLLTGYKNHELCKTCTMRKPETPC